MRVEFEGPGTDSFEIHPLGFTVILLTTFDFQHLPKLFIFAYLSATS